MFLYTNEKFWDTRNTSFLKLDTLLYNSEYPYLDFINLPQSPTYVAQIYARARLFMQSTNLQTTSNFHTTYTYWIQICNDIHLSNNFAK
jgi:hypothetical protein